MCTTCMTYVYVCVLYRERDKNSRELGGIIGSERKICSEVRCAASESNRAFVCSGRARLLSMSIAVFRFAKSPVLINETAVCLSFVVFSFLV